MHVGRLRRILYRLVDEFGQLAGALLAPAVLLLWLLDVLEVAAQRTLLKQTKPYPRLRDGVKVEWKFFGGNTRMTTRRILSRLSLLLLCCSLAAAQGIPTGSTGGPVAPAVPAPDFLITADSDSVDYDGDGSSGECTVTTAVLEEHPASSGLFAVDFDGASGTVSCGTALDQLHTGTIVAFVDHDAFGENSNGMILSKTAGGLSADRAWLVHVSDTNDRMQFSYYNNAGGSRALVSPTDSADPFADYTCVAISWTVSTLASLAGQHYIAGSPVTTSQIDAAGGDAADDDASHTVVVGNTLGDNFTWNGHIGFPLRVWRSVLTESQVAAACAQGRS